MTVFVVSYLAGVLTIVSPCILPILPFVFSRTGQPFVRGVLPMVIGMAATFAGVATLAAVGGSWAVHANEIGRSAAIALLAVFGLTLISSRAAAILPARSSPSADGSLVQEPQTSRASADRFCSVRRRACCGRPALVRSWDWF
jgi:cytochrome c biogenesis protein CcdA